MSCVSSQGARHQSKPEENAMLEWLLDNYELVFIGAVILLFASNRLDWRRERMKE
jgi:hypothetical protein